MKRQPRAASAAQHQLRLTVTDEQVAAAEAQIVEHSKRIEFYLTDFSIELLAKKMEDGEFQIPSYQREDTWEPERKSRFVESLIMGLPIPFLFFWERPATGTLEIVDGSQRLRTIQQFLRGDLTIGPLSQLTELEGMTFKDLPESRQRKLKNRPIRGIILNEHADEQARFDVFERINTGSKIANKAEIRRGALIGPFLDLVIELSTHPLFVDLAPVGKMAENMREREELVTRFFAYGDGLDGYRDRPADFLYSYAKKMNQHFSDKPADVDRYRQRFVDTMTFIKKTFPHGFRRAARGTETPRTRYEAIAIGSYLAITQRPSLMQDTPDISEWFNKPEFIKVTSSGGANSIAALTNRLTFVRNNLMGVR